MTDSQISTDDSIPSYQYADYFPRFLAYLLDIVGIACIIIMASIVLRTSIDSFPPYIGSYVFTVIYNAFFLSLWSSTPGKRVMGLKIVTESGCNVMPLTAIKRSLLQPLSLVLFGSGYVSIVKTTTRQAWHDKVAKTIVVSNKPHISIPTNTTSPKIW